MRGLLAQPLCLAAVIEVDRPTPLQLAEQVRGWVQSELQSKPPPGDWTLVHPRRGELLLTLRIEANGRWMALVADNVRSLALLSKAGLVLAIVYWTGGAAREAGWDDLSRLVGASARPNGESIAALRRTLEMLGWPLVWSAVLGSEAQWARESITPWFHITPHADASHPSELTPATVLTRQLSSGGWAGATPDRMRAASSDSVRRLLGYVSIITRRPIDPDGVVRAHVSTADLTRIMGLSDNRERRLQGSLARALDELAMLAPEHAGSSLDGERVELLRLRY